MAKQVQLKARLRTETGRNSLKQVRAAGIIPACVYGAHTPPVNIAIDKLELAKALGHATGENVLVGLTVEGDQAGSRLALIQDVQHHPVNDTILHVDFHEVSATEKLRTNVPVRPVGEPAGVKTGGGVLEFILRELRVECLPKDLPDVIEINVEKLEIGEAIHIQDVPAPAGGTLLDPKDQPVFLVVAPIAEEVVEAVPGEMVEPEVIGAKKEEGEEGEAAPAEKGKGEAKPAAGAVPAKDAEAKPAAGAKPAAAAAPAKGAKPEAKK